MKVGDEIDLPSTLTVNAKSSGTEGDKNNNDTPWTLRLTVSEVDI
jgi:hypothetical protein